MAASTSRWWALGALALGTLAVGLDTTVLSVALPTLATDLHATTAGLQWFTNAYLLVLAAALLPAGMLGDRFGRKRMLLGALLIFGLASAACAYAGSTGQLIAARAALGLGAAVIMPLTSAVLTVLFEPGERSRALTVWVTASALGVPLGPLAGGWLLDNYWWGSVFLINVPLVLVAVVAVALWVPESHGERARRFDPLGLLLSTIALVTVTYGIIERSGPPVAAGLVVLAGFVLWQRRAAAPLVDLGLFASRDFTGGTIMATLASFGLLGVLFALPQYFQAVGGHDALGSGLRLLPMIGGLLIGARVAGRVLARLGTRVVVTLGMALIAGGLFAGAATTVTSGYGFVGAWVGVVGLGLGFAMPPSMNAALGALSPLRSGIGSGLLQSLRQVGGAIGVAVLGTVLSSGYHDRLPAGASAAVRDSASAGVAVAQSLGDPALLGAVRSAFVHGMSEALLVAAVVALAGAALAVFLLPARPPIPVSPRPAAESAA